MTLRLADIGARIEGVQQLGTVVDAMSGIAAARARQAREQIGAVDSYTAVIAGGIAHALALLPEHPPALAKARARSALIVFAAEQGFAGTFSERVFDAIGADLTHSTLFLIGTRGAAVLAERGITPDWSSALPSHSASVPRLADQTTEALYARIAKGEIDQLDVVFARSGEGRQVTIDRNRLLPIDAARFSRQPPELPPLLYLEPAVLLARLTADYLHAELCHAALHAFAAENEARMEAMASARDQILRQLTSLRAQERQVRQEEITAEVIELAAGAVAGSPVES